MARDFGSYSPAAPLGVTWEESIQLIDDAGVPVDLTGYSAHAQLRTALPVRASGVATTAPVLELTTAGFYDTPPAWPTIDALTIPTPANGTILIAVSAADLWTLSPTNAKKRKLLWSIVLVNKDTGYAIPVVKGSVTIKAATSMLPVAP